MPGGDGCFGLSFQLELETCTTRYCRAYSVVCYREKKQIMKQRYEEIREKNKRQETIKGKERKKKKKILKQRSKDLNEDKMEVHFPKFMSEMTGWKVEFFGLSYCVMYCVELCLLGRGTALHCTLLYFSYSAALSNTLILYSVLLFCTKLTLMY